MGRGPSALLGGLREIASEQGDPVTCEILECRDEHMAEIRSTFTLASQTSERVSEVRAEGATPVVLSGNCNGALGTIAGLGASSTAVLWFDAHGEFETPETTRSGFLDGMGLAIATGTCWRNMSEQIARFTPVPAEHITLAGLRKVGAEEDQNLGDSGIHVVRADAFHRGSHLAAARAACEAAGDCRSLYIHFDLDALDSGVGSWNRWTENGGLTIDHIGDAVREFAGRIPIGAIGFGSYEPAADGDGEAAKAAAKLMLVCLEAMKARGAGKASGR